MTMAQVDHNLTTAPLVSVCIPNFNMARYLPAALDSALAQTYSDIEILAIDNHSTDESWAVLKEYSARDSRCRVLRNPINHGLPRNWNRCLHEARGTYLVMLSADDTLEPAFVQRCLKYHLHFPDLGYVGTEWYEIDEQGIQTPRKPFFHTAGVVRAAEEARLNLIGSHTLPSAMLIHRQRLIQVGGYDEQYHWAIDIDAKLKLNLHWDAGYLPDLLCNYRVHSGQDLTGGIRSKLLLMDIYRAKTAILDQLPAKNRGLEVFRDRMRANMAKCAVDYAEICQDQEQAELALEYLFLAKSFHLEVDRNPRFQELWSQLGQEVVHRDQTPVTAEGTGLPVWPYDMPEGSVIIDL